MEIIAVALGLVRKGLLRETQPSEPVVETLVWTSVGRVEFSASSSFSVSISPQIMILYANIRNIRSLSQFHNGLIVVLIIWIISGPLNLLPLHSTPINSLHPPPPRFEVQATLEMSITFLIARRIYLTFTFVEGIFLRRPCQRHLGSTY